ncbi:RcnB family protein [Brevundimonas viscosa]|uniref:Regulator RcnB of Ni and Co efflux n=1 Tax=Brevundimonas viscosa TaxID=871741 RepID=A0A1I6SXN1_9CAUL|nr:RcnB family protein [Brevundimonas viscosa]SFS81660.1 regulator RcnB of Ni and Co efflux [Brevundimonas viscosa]
MKKFVTAAVAATLALGSVGMASAAEAQSRGDRYEQRQDRREWRQERREDRREWRQDRREDRREARQQQRAYARWQQAQRRYHAPRYYAPSGYQVRSWSYGQQMPYAYRTQRYVINDYGRYGLERPPHGYQYVRSGNDVVLAAVAGGLISAVIAGLFN